MTVQAAAGSYVADQTFLWNVSSPIAIAAPADQANSEGDIVSLAIGASDATGGTLNYLASGLPAGLEIDGATGVIAGTVAVGAAAEGPYTVTVVAEDGTYNGSANFHLDRQRSGNDRDTGRPD